MNYIKIILLAALGVIAVLLLIAVIRTIFLKAKHTDKKSAISYTPDEENEYAECLSDMIKVPTISSLNGSNMDKFIELHEVMEKHFPLVFSKLEKTDLDGNLLFKWKGKDSSKEGILLMGHQDVVPAEETTWEHGPFSGDIENGKVHGRGAMDCKCTVMAEFAAVEELLREGFVPECDVYLACSINEEISGDGAPKTVEYLKNNNIRLAAVCDEGGAIMSGLVPGLSSPTAAIGIVEKGFVNVKITAKGAGGHSSTPPRHSQIAKLAEFINYFEHKRPFKTKMTMPLIKMLSGVAPYLSFPLRLVLGNIWLFKPLLTLLLPVLSPMTAALVQTTFAFTMCGGSKAPNVLPDEAYVICNLRPAVHQQADESIEIVRKYAEKFGLEVEVLKKRNTSRVNDPESDEFKYLTKCINECHPNTAVTPFYMTGGTDCRNYEAVSDNCLRFCPTRLNPQQLSAMHAANENLDTAALAEGVKFYKYYIKNRK